MKQSPPPRVKRLLSITMSPVKIGQPRPRALLLTPVLFALAAFAARAGAEAKPEYLVGVYYFSGWWRETPNKYMVAGRDWRTNYPERVALLGQYNEQETMDREIAAAAAHGISFFQILWYPQPNATGRPTPSEKLNEGLRLFMASTNNSRMKFTLEFVNHPPFGLETDAPWETACRQWCQAMQHSSYLRLEGRPVFKIHSADFFSRQNGHDPARVVGRLATLRRLARAAGLADPLICGGVAAGWVASGPVAAPYDFLATYMEMPTLPRREKPYPYQDLLQYAQNGWKRYAQSSRKMYAPFLPAGWDPRPWNDSRPSFAFPTREQWTTALRTLKTALDDSSNLGVPLGNGRRQKMLLIYAWNEFGEGGIVAPTKGEAAMKLQAIKAVFAGN